MIEQARRLVVRSTAACTGQLVAAGAAEVLPQGVVDLAEEGHVGVGLGAPEPVDGLHPAGQNRIGEIGEIVLHSTARFLRNSFSALLSEDRPMAMKTASDRSSMPTAHRTRTSELKPLAPKWLRMGISALIYG